MDPGFLLLGTRQQGVPVILRELVLPVGIYLVSPSFTVRDVTTELSEPNYRVTKNQWISSRSIALIYSRKLIPSDSEHDEERKKFRSRLSKSPRNDREKWWASKAKVMEKAAAIGNTRQLYRLIK
ncbi:unnamed protein product [Schistosoma margrebowiei]|uniref:Uncharacterized protein n=1 Tax=Schistosoma margrebowiei TaxID=48269 RepID=A0A3P7Z4A7_9TREM|nr:unnamed protein product [Schistosoma margrebowiei]